MIEKFFPFNAKFLILSFGITCEMTRSPVSSRILYTYIIFKYTYTYTIEFQEKYKVKVPRIIILITTKVLN